MNRVAIRSVAVVDEAAEAGGDEEDGERDQEHPPAAEQVGGAAAEQQEAAVAEHVRAHHPLQRAGGHVEVGADRREGDADHRDVEGVEEEGAAEHEQHAPRAPAQPVGAAVEGRRMRVSVQTRISSFAEEGRREDERWRPPAFRLLFDQAPYIICSMLVKQ